MRTIMNKILLIFFIFTTFCSCNDFLDITPTGKVIPKTFDEYSALLAYEYKYVPDDRGLVSFRSDEFTLTKGISSDDINSYYDIWAWNDSTPQSTTTPFGWRRYYHAIYIANYIIEHKNEITDGKINDINQLIGECYMMRGYMHFLLINLFAKPYNKCNPETEIGIPLQLKADVEDVLKPNTIKECYNSIINDLTMAQKYLDSTLVLDASHRYRFSYESSSALLSRVYLYMGDYEKTLANAKTAIKLHGTLQDLNKVTTLPNLYKSVETILALEQVITARFSDNGISVNKDFYDSYVNDDKRKKIYFTKITSSKINLLKIDIDSRCSIRSAELYLNAAEAALQLNKRDSAEFFLNSLIDKRYSVTNATTYKKQLSNMTNDDFLTELINERTRELAYEGHRWFDLRRTTQPRIEKTYEGKTSVLEQGDLRYTLKFPTEAMEANPYLIK